MPLGPRVLLTRSPTAMAPTKAVRRAFSPFSSVVPSSKIWVGLKEACARHRQYFCFALLEKSNHSGNGE